MDSGLSWLAGYIQGDGSVSKDIWNNGYKDYEYDVVRTTTKDAELADALMPYGFHKYWQERKNRTPYWWTKISGAEAKALLQRLQDHWNGRMYWAPWAAGFFDAEGYVGHNGRYWRASVTNKKASLLQPYKERYGGSVIHTMRTDGRDCYQYQAQCRQVRKMAKEIAPFVHLTRKSEKLVQAQEVPR